MMLLMIMPLQSVLPLSLCQRSFPALQPFCFSPCPHSAFFQPHQGCWLADVDETCGAVVVVAAATVAAAAAAAGHRKNHFLSYITRNVAFMFTSRCR